MVVHQHAINSVLVVVEILLNVAVTSLLGSEEVQEADNCNPITSGISGLIECFPQLFVLESIAINGHVAPEQIVVLIAGNQLKSRGIKGSMRYRTQAEQNNGQHSSSRIHELLFDNFNIQTANNINLTPYPIIPQYLNTFLTEVKIYLYKYGKSPKKSTKVSSM